MNLSVSPSASVDPPSLSGRQRSGVARELLRIRLGLADGAALDALLASLGAPTALAVAADPSAQSPLQALLAALPDFLDDVDARCAASDQAVEEARRGMRDSATGLAKVNERLYMQLVSSQRALGSLRGTVQGLLRDAGLPALDTGEGEDLEMLARQVEGLVQDLVSARAALQQAHAGLAQQKAALDEHAIVSITDLQGVITYVNSRFCAISGYAREELLGQTHRIVNSGHHSRDFFADLWRTIERGEVWRGEICNRKRNAETYWVSATIVPLRDADGVIEQYVAIRTDITERKHWEAEMLSARAAAEAANRAKDEFLANMSHEIRTPLNGILGMAELALQSGPEGSLREYLEVVHSSGESLLGIINDILDLSKIEAGKMRLESIPFDPLKLSRDVLRLFGHQAARKDLELRAELDPALPAALIGDPGRVRQILLNLIGNAVKFTERGHVVLRLRWEPVGQTTDAPGRLQVEVEDTGIGIPSEKQAAIFEAFTQEDSSTTRRFGGTGLGLTISTRLVALMGGSFRLRSAPGQGSCFACSLQLVPAQWPPARSASELADGAERLAPPDAVAIVAQDSGAVTAGAGAALEILVAEDNPVNQRLMQALLGKWGHRVTLAPSGREALACFAEQRFDLILMDIQMPDMGGLEATRRIRELEARTGAARTPIVALSAAAMDSDRQRADEAGFDAYLTKPLRQAALQALLTGLGSPG